jgi:MFS family permease
VTNFLDDAKYIVTVAIIARLINGFATSLFMTPLYAYIPLLFPDSIQAKISIAEIFAAMGFLFGPVLGSLLHSLGGYNLPFIFFGSLALVLVPIMALQFRALNKNLIKIEDEYK